MTPLEIEIDYHNDRHWGMANDAIDDISYHRLALRLDKEQPNSKLRHQIHNSIPSKYWDEKLLSNLLDSTTDQIKLAKAKIWLHCKFTGMSIKDMFRNKDRYLMKLLVATSMSIKDRVEMKLWLENGGGEV